MFRELFPFMIDINITNIISMETHYKTCCLLYTKTKQNKNKNKHGWSFV